MVAHSPEFEDTKLQGERYDAEKGSDVVVHDKTLAPPKQDEDTLHRGLKSRQVRLLVV